MVVKDLFHLVNLPYAGLMFQYGWVDILISYATRFLGFISLILMVCYFQHS
jgi:hypothetical protein